jgi:hypothetical protein
VSRSVKQDYPPKLRPLEQIKVLETTIAPDGTLTITGQLNEAQTAFMDRGMLSGFSIKGDK